MNDEKKPTSFAERITAGRSDEYRLRTPEEAHWATVEDGIWPGTPEHAVDDELVALVRAVDAWLGTLKERVANTIEVPIEDVATLRRFAEAARAPSAVTMRSTLLSAVDEFAEAGLNLGGVPDEDPYPMPRGAPDYRRLRDLERKLEPLLIARDVVASLRAVIAAWHDDTPRRAPGLAKGTPTKKADGTYKADGGGKWATLAKVMADAGFCDGNGADALRAAWSRGEKYRSASETSQGQKNLARFPPPQSDENAAAWKAWARGEVAQCTERSTPPADAGIVRTMATAKKTSAKKATAAKAEPKRMGRPPKPVGERRTASLNLRLHASERAELEAGAERFGLTVTEFLLAAAREKLARNR